MFISYFDVFGASVRLSLAAWNLFSRFLPRDTLWYIAAHARGPLGICGTYTRRLMSPRIGSISQGGIPSLRRKYEAPVHKQEPF